MSGRALLPCPFCGGVAELREGEECAYVQCLSAKYHRGPFVDGDNNAAAEAIAAWNTRAATPRTDAGEVEWLREALLAMGRMIPGVILDDRVSTDFLIKLPDEMAHYHLHKSAPSVGGEGWKLVPVEPTPEMVDNAFDLDATEMQRRNIWSLMLAAAPSRAGDTA